MTPFYLPATPADFMHLLAHFLTLNTLIGVEVAVGALGLAKGYLDIKRYPCVWDNSSIAGQV
jgi:hypothetical protein